MSGSMLNTTAVPLLRHMSLSLDNGLPADVICFGTTDADEVPLSCHIDRCAAMNTGNLLLHMWIIRTYHEIVMKYEQCDDSNPFQPITLDCVILSLEEERASGKLSAVVTYKTRYTKENGIC